MKNKDETRKLFGVRGTRGLESKPFERFFATEAKRDAWLEKNSEDISIDSFCSPE